MADTVRVLVVDDSALVRKILSHLLGQHPKIEVVGAAIDAVDARAQIKQKNPDVLTLDIEMPGMNGLQFLEKVMALRPMPVIMVSTLTQRGAEASLQAMQLGAFDFFPKPKGDLARELSIYQATLQEKVLSASCANVSVLANRARRQTQNNPDEVSRLPELPVTSASALQPIIAIGSSTGGTEAVNQIMQRLPANTPGIVIAQHIPGAFSTSFAERLNQASAMQVKEAQDGDRVLSGYAFVAPGTSHLRILRNGANWICRLEDSPPVNRHKPSVDVLFDSVAREAKNRALGIILTGMGKDGAQGLLHMQEQGAQTMVQDEASSVVWGMPGAAVKLGAADEIISLHDIAANLLKKVARLT